MITLAFFGSSRFSVFVLEELHKAGYIPTCVVTIPDKPRGRKLKLKPMPVKEWAVRKGVKVFDPAKLDGKFAEELNQESFDLFIVASYGKIIPAAIIDLPAHKTLNVHPSLLPKYRGSSPIQSAMLSNDKDTGITIMRVDEETDHGPIIIQEKTTVNEWPAYEDFEESLARQGGKLLARVIPDWISGKIKERPQDHSLATYAKKVIKEDGLIDLNEDPYLNFRKIQAFHEWPQAYFFIEKSGKRLRVKITEAEYSDGLLKIKRVIPEGGKEMKYEDFERGYGFYFNAAAREVL